MSVWTLLLIAVGVSADAFAVALTKGVHMRRFRWADALAIALTFGVFQAGMPIIGWLVGSRFAPYITEVDHWVAFVLLALIGGRMLWEAFRGGANDEEDEADTGRIDVKRLLILALATSIDALAVGISFAFLPISVPLAVGLIGVITTVLAFVGVVIGRRAGARFGTAAEIAGGVILILIGTRILLDHLGLL